MGIFNFLKRNKAHNQSKGDAAVDKKVKDGENAIKPTGYVLALEYFQNKNYEKVIEDINSLASQFPDYADAFFLRGASWYLLDEFEKALMDYDKAIGLNISNSDIHLHRGMTLEGLGHFEAAKKDINNFLELVPGDPRGLKVQKRLSNYICDEPTKRSRFTCPSCGLVKILWIQYEMIVVAFKCPSCGKPFKVNVDDLLEDKLDYIKLSKTAENEL